MLVRERRAGEVGERNLRWASEYPRRGSVANRPAIERRTQHLSSPDMRRKPTYDNAARLYSLS